VRQARLAWTGLAVAIVAGCWTGGAPSRSAGTSPAVPIASARASSATVSGHVRALDRPTLVARASRRVAYVLARTPTGPELLRSRDGGRRFAAATLPSVRRGSTGKSRPIAR